MGVEGLGAVDDDGGELGMQFFEDSFTEAGTDVANSFIGVICGVVACQQEGSVYGGAFAFAIVGTEDNEVEGVAYTREVVLFNL